MQTESSVLESLRTIPEGRQASKARHQYPQNRDALEALDHEGRNPAERKGAVQASRGLWAHLLSLLTLELLQLTNELMSCLPATSHLSHRK